MLIVTGATGLLGNTLTRKALSRGHEVTALVRAESAEKPLQGLNLRKIGIDWEKDALEPVLSGAQALVHCAARVTIGRRDIEGFRRDNVLPTARLAAACRGAGVRLVHISTVDTLRFGTREAPGDESPAGPHDLDTTYAQSKREAEQAVEAEGARGLDAVVLHPGFLLGPWDWKPSSGRMLLAAVKGPMAFAPPGGNDFCHAGDVADAALKAAFEAKAGSRYVLSGEPLAYAEAFRLMRKVAGKSGPVVTAPAPLVKAAGAIGDILGAVTGREPPVNSFSAAISCVPHHFSSAKAVRELGYAPSGAEAAIRDAWTWFREHGYA